MPVLALLIIFLSFIINSFSRYLLRRPINACYELCLSGLVWCLLLSAPYAVRKHTNVKFSLIYDRLNGAGQMAFRLIGNALLIFCFSAMLFPSISWVHFMRIKHSEVLHLRMNVVYAPFVVFNILTLFHLIYDFIKDIKVLIRSIVSKEPLRKENSIESMQIDK